MASQQSDALGVAPASNVENYCKKCKSKVTNASVKCVVCNVSYHKSCFNRAAQQGKKFELIGDSEMVCADHKSPLPDDAVQHLQDLVLNLQQENNLLKKEVVRLKEEATSYRSRTLDNTGKTIAHKENAALKEEVERLNCELSSIQKNTADNPPANVSEITTDKVMLDLMPLFHKMEKTINNNMEAKFNELIVTLKTNIGEPTLSPSEPGKIKYSDALKKSDAVVVIKPKINKETLDETINRVQNEVNPDQLNLGITQFRPLKNGGVLIGCENKEDLHKLQQHMERTLSENYKFSVPKHRLPQIKIVGITAELNESELKECIIKQNPELGIPVSGWKQIVFKRVRKSYIAIFELDAESYKKVRRKGSLFIKWAACPVYEYYNLFRCFKCAGFNHSSANCEYTESVCFKCGETGHKETACTRQLSCLNCQRSNMSTTANKLPTDHSIYDTIKCKCIQKQIEILQQKTCYDSSITS